MAITVADWEPSVSKLPVYGQRVISSADWKFIIYEIYQRLNDLKLAASCYADPTAPATPFTGMLWLDTTNSLMPQLNIYVVTKWFKVELSEVF
jgi:hypothetical protein